MHRLRSRWTVVALVPAFFLAGFGLVTALAEGSDDAVPAAADGEPGGADGNGAPTATGVGQTTTADSTPGASTDATDAPATSTTDGEGSGTTTPDGNGSAARAPSSGTIAVDYGRWEGLFEISDAEIVPEFAFATVTGEFRYLGGADCSQLGFVELRGQFYGPTGQPIGEGLWESIWVTGEGAEVPQREPLWLEFRGEVSEEPASARIRFTRVDCL